MAEASQYDFSLNELTELLIKEAGVKTGYWAGGFNLNLGAGLMGGGPNDLYPSGMMQIIGVTLNKIDPNVQPPHPFAVDAATLWPK